jgi:predicted O-linked N-acetylglucosamine transferase (SPINDLY family)
MSAQRLQNAYRAHAAGNIPEAVRVCRDILRDEPRHFDALYLLGFLLSRLGQSEEGEVLIGKALKINPRAPDAWYNRGCLLQEMNRHKEALAAFERALALKPDFPDAAVNRGIALLALKRPREALAIFDKIVQSQPADPEAWNNRANAQLSLDRSEDALLSLDRALACNGRFADAWSNRGTALHRLRRYEEALGAFDHALALKPGGIEALCNRANTLLELRRYSEALAGYGAALQRAPDSVLALTNRGNASMLLRDYDKALADYDRALTAQPGNADALYNRANVLWLMKRTEDAIRDCEKLIAADPHYDYAPGALVHCKLHGCDWRGLRDAQAAVLDGVRHGRRAISPFQFLAFSSAPKDQLACARIAVAHKYPPAQAALWRGEIYRHDKIRVAYLSADFHAHATAHLMAGLFEAHDRTRFETFALSFGPDDKSPMRARLERAFSRFLDLRGRSDREIAGLMRQLEIDIAVDLKGYTQDCRSFILAQRAAPLQVNYLGYPGTMGAEYIDYIVADSIVLPESERVHYAEKVLSLPDSYQCNDARRPIAESAGTRADFGLPADAFVFCCFNNNFKIAPEMFAIWMRLLAQTENSVLWLLADNAFAARNLRREAQARGVAGERIVFAERLDAAKHLARYRLADLFLDTLPYGAHTTASDALWAGLPVLTALGSAFAGRVGASLLSAIGLPDLIAPSLEAYERMALAMAHDPARLAALRATLARHRETHPLFDTQRFARTLERGYEAIWRRYQDGAPPAHIALPAEARSYA